MWSFYIAKEYAIFWSLSVVFTMMHQCLSVNQWQEVTSEKYLSTYLTIGSFGFVACVFVAEVAMMATLVWMFNIDRVHISEFYLKCVKKYRLSQEETLMVINYGKKLCQEGDLIDSRDRAFGWQTVFSLRLPMVVECGLNFIAATSYVLTAATSGNRMGLIEFAPLAGLLLFRIFALFSGIEFWGSLYEKHVVKHWPQKCYKSVTLTEPKDNHDEGELETLSQKTNKNAVDKIEEISSDDAMGDILIFPKCLIPICICICICNCNCISNCISTAYQTYRQKRLKPSPAPQPPELD